MGKLVAEKRPIAIARSDNEDARRLALLNEAGERAAGQSAHLIAGVQEEQVGSSRRVAHRRHPEQRKQFSTYHRHGISDCSCVSVGGAAAREMQPNAGCGDRAPVSCTIGQQPSSEGTVLVR
jgi:hypothetical protein